MCFALICFISFHRVDFFRENIETFDTARGYLLVLSFTIISAIYYFYFKSASEINEKILFTLAILIGLACFVSPPFSSVDLPSYLLAAKNLYVGHLSPYTSSFVANKDTVWLNQIGHIWWLDYPTPYGPLFTLISGIPLIFTDNLLVALYIFKLLALISYITVVYLIYKRLPADQSTAKRLALLFVLNPAILVHIVLEGHNDIFVILLFLIAYLLFLQKKNLAGIFGLIGSALIKFNTLALLPVFWFEKERLSVKKIVLSVSVAAGFLLMFIFCFGIFRDQSFLKLPKIISEGCLYRCDPYHTLIHFIPSKLQSSIGYLISIALYGIVCYRYLFNQFSFLKFSFWASFIFIYILASWNAPWYATLLITIGILINETKYFYLVCLLTAYSLLHIYLPF